MPGRSYGSRLPVRPVGVARGVGRLGLRVGLVVVDVVGDRQAGAGGHRRNDVVHQTVGADDQVEPALVVGVEHRVEVHDEVGVVGAGIAHLRVGLNAVEGRRDVKGLSCRGVVAVFGGALRGIGPVRTCRRTRW